MWAAHHLFMTGQPKWWHRLLELFVIEVRQPDGSIYLIAIDSPGFGECSLPIEFTTLPATPDDY